MAWMRRFHITCDGCGRMWLDGALTKAEAERHALTGGWTATNPPAGPTRHWCTACTPPDDADPGRQDTAA